MSKKKWKEPENCKWYLIEYEYAYCSVCGGSYYTGFSSTKEAEEKWNEEHLYHYCPHCGTKMFEETGKDVMPENMDGFDKWLDKVQAFNESFETVLKIVVYLWKVRHLVKEETLRKLAESSETALKQFCQYCGEECAADCPVHEFLDELKGRKNVKVESGAKGEVHS